MDKYHERLDVIQSICFWIALFGRINRNHLHIEWLQQLEPFFIINGIVFYLCCIAQIYITWKETRSIKTALMRNKCSVIFLLLLTFALCLLGAERLA